MFQLRISVISLFVLFVFANNSLAMDNRFCKIVSFPNTIQIRDSLNNGFCEIKKGRFIFKVERPENFPDGNVVTSVTMTGAAQTEDETQGLYSFDSQLLDKRFTDKYSVTAPFEVVFSGGQKVVFPLKIALNVCRYRRLKESYLVKHNDIRDPKDFEIRSSQPNIEGNIVFTKDVDYQALLFKNNAHLKPEGFVWLIRESKSLDGGLVVSYLVPSTKNGALAIGSENLIYVLEKSAPNNWVSVLPNGLDKNGQKSEFIKIYADSHQICGRIQFLYETLKGTGFNLSGQIIPDVN